MKSKSGVASTFNSGFTRAGSRLSQREREPTVVSHEMVQGFLDVAAFRLILGVLWKGFTDLFHVPPEDRDHFLGMIFFSNSGIRNSNASNSTAKLT